MNNFENYQKVVEANDFIEEVCAEIACVLPHINKGGCAIFARKLAKVLNLDGKCFKVYFITENCGFHVMVNSGIQNKVIDGNGIHLFNPMRFHTVEDLDLQELNAVCERITWNKTFNPEHDGSLLDGIINNYLQA